MKIVWGNNNIHWYLIPTWSDKDFNGTVVNRALPSLNGGGSLEIKNPRVTFENFTYETPLVNDLQFILFNLIILQQFLGENRIQIRPKPHEKFMLVFLFIKLAYNKSNKILNKDLSELQTFKYISSYEKSIKLQHAELKTLISFRHISLLFRLLAFAMISYPYLESILHSRAI